MRDGFGAERSLITLAGDQTLATPHPTSDPYTLTIREGQSGVVVRSLAFESFGPAGSRAALHASVAAALALGVPVPEDATERPIVVVLEGAAARPPPSTWAPWMGDAITWMALDPELAAEARAAHASSERPMEAGWVAVAHDPSGHVIVAATAAAAPEAWRRADGPASAQPVPALWILARADPRSTLLPALVRSVLHARMPDASLREAEVLPISDAQLERWRRPAGDVDAQSIRDPDVSDRQWIWTMVVALLGVEMLIRRRMTRVDAAEDGSRVRAA
jgi:hypothetical protein